MMELTKHFSLREATRSQTADRLGISNDPSPAELDRIMETALKMEGIRSVLGDNPVIVSSWFRNEAVNRAVGGVPSSSHLRGDAVDFTCPRFGDVTKVCKAIRDSDMNFDQLIWEHNRWVHISFDPRNRRQVMRTKPEGGYAFGLPE